MVCSEMWWGNLQPFPLQAPRTADGVLAPSLFKEEAVEVFFGFPKEFGCGGPLLAAGVACGKGVWVGLGVVTVVIAEE
jgi:hypothetical protein